MGGRRLVVVLLLSVILFACSEAPEVPLPEVQFVSPWSARVTYQGRTYLLTKGQPAPAGFPFRYRFEDDGDLDLLVGGRWIEFDNPFDIDIKFSKKRSKKGFKKKYRTKSFSRTKRRR